jgi:pyruvate,orthophosphate dikinase
LPASPGAAVGKVVFNAEDAKMWAEKGESVILARLETSPEDIEGMHSAVGILTARGGMTSHAAVVARGMGKCCVSGCDEIVMDEKGKKFTCKGMVIKEGDTLSLNGSTGHVIMGAVPVVEPTLSGDFGTLMSWADGFRKLKVRTNADTPHDARVARNFGAEGIGLVRTEHMFFEATRIKAVREMILAKDTGGRKKALAKIEPYQREDFEGIFEAMNGLPVIIRMLDPPLHEFLPKHDQVKEIEDLAKELNTTPKEINETIVALHEFNPMLGFRGCRLAVVYPEIMEMQVRAIFEAAMNVAKKGVKALPEIEIPIVGNVKEYKPLADLTHRIAKETGAVGKVHYTVGTMIEVPRAALTADLLAKEAEFMSFGTNDLTQMTCGFSRDDAGKFLGHYVEKGIYAKDPFQSIDQEGVGLLMKHTVQLARGVKKDLDIGICGEHGGDPATVEFCHRIGMSNVSCSPYRVPIARLAAAHAAIKEKMAAKAPAAKGKKK